MVDQRSLRQRRRYPPQRHLRWIREPVWVLDHYDADGLAAAALFARFSPRKAVQADTARPGSERARQSRPAVRPMMNTLIARKPVDLTVEDRRPASLQKPRAVQHQRYVAIDVAVLDRMIRTAKPVSFVAAAQHRDASPVVSVLRSVYQRPSDAHCIRLGDRQTLSGRFTQPCDVAKSLAEANRVTATR